METQLQLKKKKERSLEKIQKPLESINQQITISKNRSLLFFYVFGRMASLLYIEY